METPPRLRFLTWLVVIAGLLAVPTCGRNEPSTPTSPSALPGIPFSRSVDGKIPVTGDELAEPSTFESAAVGPLALDINPSVFKGGDSTRGTVTLADPAPEGGVVIALASDDTAARVPASVTIAHGGTSGSFTITTREVPSDVRIRITASAEGESRTALIRLTPVNKFSLSIDPVIIGAGKSATGTVTLNSTFSGSTVVTLSSDKTDARVPATLTIAQGNKSGTFTIETAGVSTPTEVWIEATVGRETRSVQIRVTPAAVGANTGSLTFGGKVS